MRECLTQHMQLAHVILLGDKDRLMTIELHDDDIPHNMQAPCRLSKNATAADHDGLLAQPQDGAGFRSRWAARLSQERASRQRQHKRKCKCKLPCLLNADSRPGSPLSFSPHSARARSCLSRSGTLTSSRSSNDYTSDSRSLQRSAS